MALILIYDQPRPFKQVWVTFMKRQGKSSGEGNSEYKDSQV